MVDDPSKTLEMPAIAIDPVTGAPLTDREPFAVTARHPMVEPLDDGNAGALTEKAISIAAPATRDRATLTVITGVDAGQVFSLDAADASVGRGLEASMILEDAAISRLHARIVRSEDGRHAVHDLGSTNGTFVSGRRVERAPLVSGDRIQVGPNVILRFAITDEAEESLLRRLYESSTRDALTSAFNRKYFCERLKTEIAYAERHGTSLAVLLLDVDHFKQINDGYGHLMGDQVLRAVSHRIAGVIRREDVFARYGGEEFAVLARSGNAVDAERLAERLRVAIEHLRVPAASSVVTVTVSIGVASLAECLGGGGGGGGETELIALADTRLYKAKAAGRNRVCTE
jgi:two-component system cell cycle response regulator